MKLKLTLLSDAIPGSGEGLSGMIDTDIRYDDTGIPFIPGKRLKGLLRESALECQDAGILSENDVKTIFGVSGNDTGCVLKIGNGYLTSYANLRQFLRKVQNDDGLGLHSLFNKEAILRYFTYIREQTTIDPKTGTAQENTLRTIRVLRKNLVFEFDCFSDHPEKLKTICQVTRHFGISRTRGFGEIMLSLIDEEEPQGEDTPTESANDGTSAFSDTETCSMDVWVMNDSQLLFAPHVGVHQSSEHYIPGTYLLGAMANRFLESPPSATQANPDLFHALFLSSQVQFSNLYPFIDGRQLLPSPKSILKEKDTNNYYDIAFQNDLEKLLSENIQTKGGLSGFSEITPNGTIEGDVECEMEYHHRRPPDKRIGHAKKEESGKDNGAFFQFEVIKAGQIFKGEITGCYNHLKTIADLIDQNLNVYLGKSRTAQYGSCNIEHGKIIRCMSNEEQKTEWKAGDRIVITLTSDMILLNESGFPEPNPDILIQELASKLNVTAADLKIDQKILKFSLMGGYLGIWNLPRIHTQVLQAGSVITVKNTSEKEISLKNLKFQSFGIRTEDGFGRISINRHGLKEISVNPKENSTFKYPEKWSDIKELFDMILLNHLKNACKKKILEKPQTKINLSERMGSFISRLIDMITDASSFKALDDFLHELKDRKNYFQQIGSLLFIKDKKVQQEEFVKKLHSVNPVKENSKLRQLIENAECSEDGFYSGQIFSMYQFYAVTLLQSIKWTLREGK